ncbi:LLM class flavin-dependent oxidoreductase [Streptococcus sp. E24BD]|uniref:LLM class flavin-dependent oxidoreductase n=1 Tax=Streptococcus sp. E24BD TaxID=3278715 RepID=UPI00359CD3E2
MKQIELGISTFGDTSELVGTGKPLAHDQRLRDLVEEIELADQVGLDFYGIGEHHREDFAVSAPEIVLAAGAVKTKRIRLSSAVTVLSSIDPIRLYQQYATIDALSNGRAEIMAGRGSFTESFPLFGYDLKDYEELFDEKLEMLLAIKDSTYLNWTGKHTQTVDNKPVLPRAVQKDFPIWVATGGNAASTVKIAEKGLPIAYVIIGGNPRAFKQLTKAYREIGQQAGHDSDRLKIAAHSWGWLAETTEQAVEDYFLPTKIASDNIGRTRPYWRPLTREYYDSAVGPDGAMFVGDADTVAEKMIRLIEDLDLDRFMLHLPIGSMPYAETLKAIRIYDEQVAPKVRAYFAGKA